MNGISRRQFLFRTGTVAAAAVAASTLSPLAWGDPLGLPVGIQLYTVGSDVQKDAPAAIAKIAQIGYREVETAGFGSLKTAPEFRKALDANGLKCPSAHVALKLNDLQKSFDECNALGCTYATSSVPKTMAMTADMGAMTTPEQRKAARESMLAPMTPDEFKVLAEQMNKVGEAAKKNGLKFCAHNHTMEFAMDGSKPGYDYLITHTEPSLVSFEIDCGWMSVAGYKPVDYARMYRGRVVMLHIKDFLPFEKGASTGGPVRPLGSEIGQGVVDYRAIFAGMKGLGIQHAFVEQEAPYSRMPAMEAAAVDYKFLHSLS